MTIALWCVLFGAILPILCAGLSKAGAADFDNSKPREWRKDLQGWRKRADSAQSNGFEAFPLFAVAVLVATVKGAPAGAVDMLALLWVALRLSYVAAYLADYPTARSALFALSFFTAVAIFVSPLWA